MARQTPSVPVSGVLQRTGTDPTVVLYQSIGDTPIIRTDLSALAEPITNTYYQHTGTTTDTYTAGIIYFYNGSEYLALDNTKNSDIISRVSALEEKIDGVVSTTDTKATTDDIMQIFQ